ncbi:inositol or phosphatidylinositol kinase, putative [Ricinus communis]|uniref:1-phosphatidylinositol 4-kinase n=2 Tax=Ricinus communis TaxID=3988 RepID=B9SCE9_RICCO|nr:inositol or phosphatidylinositol kinase, putative [Ricinus communis]
MAVAIDQNHGFRPFNRSQRCRLQSFTHFDYNIHEPSQTNLNHSLKQVFEVANIHRSFSTPCISLSTGFEEEFDLNARVEIVGGHGAPRVRALVVEVAIAMASGVDPMPVSSGLGGAYFLRSRNGDNIAVAKPIDEEPLAFNNPKGFGGLMIGQPGMQHSVRVGGTGIRELAAYLLDHGGFAGVPPTALVKIAHVGFHANDDAADISPPSHKIASLQRFVDHDFDAGELGPSGFSVASVHRIGIFDIRLLNLDRHAGNILVKKNGQHENYAVGTAELVPIDHGLCLPEGLDNPYFEWLHWPQASVPFSETESEYISNLDPFEDAEFLRNELPSLRESSIRVLVLCTIFLKQAATAGFCLADIGEMMTREPCGGEENLSVLENLCAKAKASAVSTSNDEADDDHDGNMNNEQIRDENEEVTIFQFDDESENASNGVSDVPQILPSPSNMDNQSKIPNFSSSRSMPRLHNLALSPPYEEYDYDNNDARHEEKLIKENRRNDDENGSKALGGLTRSISYSVENCNCETESISLGDMSKGEWELFLKCFEKLLPEAFEGTKCMAPKLRLGTSCQF